VNTVFCSFSLFVCLFLTLNGCFGSVVSSLSVAVVDAMCLSGRYQSLADLKGVKEFFILISIPSLQSKTLDNLAKCIFVLVDLQSNSCIDFFFVRCGVDKVLSYHCLLCHQVMPNSSIALGNWINRPIIFELG